MAQAADTHVNTEPVRAPGDFVRHPHTGAPYVAHPTDTRKADGKPKRAQYGRPSSFGKVIEDATNLQKWAERAVALGVFLDSADAGNAPVQPESLLDRIAALAPEQLNLDDPDAKVVLDEVATIAKRVARTGLASERGTHGHALTEDNDEDRDWVVRAAAGEDLGLGHEVQAALVSAWEMFLAVHDVEVLAVELPVVDDEWRLAGTLDRVVRLRKPMTFVVAGGELVTLPAGWVGILDIKTGKLRVARDGHPDYWHGYAPQIASYAKAVPYDTELEVRGEWPWAIDQRWGIIAHLDVLAALDGAAVCRPVLVDLEGGRAAGDLCLAAKEWAKRRNVFSLVTNGDNDVVVPVQIATGPAPATGPVAPPDGPTTAEPDPDGPVAPDDDTAQREALRARLRAMRQNATDTGWRWEFEAKLAEHALSPESTVAEIKAALDAIEPPFAGPAPEPRPYVVPVATGPAPEPPALADPAMVAQLVEDVRASDFAEDVNRWLADAHAAGRSWHPLIAGTVDNYHRTAAAHALAEAVSGDDEIAQLMVAKIVPPAATVGESIAALDAGGARQLEALAGAFGTPEFTLIFHHDGQPELVGDVAAVLAAT